MLRKLEYICVVGCVALIGADRIDLLAGHGFLRLTPFLFFAPLILSLRLLFTGSGERIPNCNHPSASPSNSLCPCICTVFTILLSLRQFSALTPTAVFCLFLTFACVRLGILHFGAGYWQIPRQKSWLCAPSHLLWSYGYSFALAHASHRAKDSFVYKTNPHRPSDLFLRLPQPYLAWRPAYPALVSIQTAPASFW